MKRNVYTTCAASLDFVCTQRVKFPVMPDATRLITALGGPTKVCELLGYDKRGGGVQRINNWRFRGIPYKVQLSHASLWLSAERAADLQDSEKSIKRRKPTRSGQGA